MNEHSAILDAITADPDDDKPRLAYADWLEEHGDRKRAEFIRVQCELEPIRDQFEIARARELDALEGDLLWFHMETWLGEMPEGWDAALHDARSSIEFRRGFPDTLALPARTFLQFGGAIRELHPTNRRVVLFRIDGYGERLAACEALEGITELELACWYSVADAAAIARSRHLKRLQVLTYWLGSNAPGQHDETCCRILGSTNAWPNLRELILMNPYDEEGDVRKRLMTTANEAANRNISVYRVGYPSLFPFAADFYYTFPGHLPDGRTAMAAEDYTTNPPTLCVITFDTNGKQTEDVIRVAAPDDILAVPTDDWYLHKPKLEKQLVDVLGFQPGFIKVQGCRFPGDEYEYDFPYPEKVQEFGERGKDDEDSWDMSPNGYGGETWRHIHEGDWIFGWDRFGDKRGEIHST